MAKENYIKLINQKLSEYSYSLLSSDHDPLFLVEQSDLLNICKILKTDSELDYSILIDICAVDYLTYGQADWVTNEATKTGYSRAVEQKIIADDDDEFPDRFAIFYQLLSISNNSRITLKTFTTKSNTHSVLSINKIWNSANWFEREAFDLMGVHFKGHPDLRPKLTDHGFIGHPFKKDFSTNGNLEVTYDEDEEKVVYKPVSITTRPSVPRVIRKDND